VAIFYKGTGAIAQPARSIVSVFFPVDTEVDLSNLYRVWENIDLQTTARHNPLGYGFGKPFEQPHILPNILSLDPYYLYIPHNTIFWIWMRLGFQGYVALWFLIGSAVVRGCMTARSLKDPYLQLVAIFIVATTFMQVILAFADYQFYFYRNVIFIGILFGILMKLPALDNPNEEEALKEQSTNEVVDGVGISTTSLLGSGRT
jgi:hypothetical protein